MNNDVLALYLSIGKMSIRLRHPPVKRIHVSATAKGGIMCSKTVPRGLYLGLAVLFSLLMSQWSYALLTGASFKSVNYKDHYIRHRGFLGYIEPINENDAVGIGDAIFRIVPGLAGRCKSFESLNLQDHFLRHQNYRLKLAKKTNDQLFREDATFCIVKGLARPSASSFESVNFPNRYIRHRNFELWLDPFEDSKLFRADATFIITGPVHASDTEQIPIDD